MKTNDPSSNNPSNPLYKTAALGIEKIYDEDNSRTGSVFVTLTFKRSSDFSGSTYDKQGNNITINFTLSIKNAAFTIKTYDSEGIPNGDVIKFENVAFQAPLIKESQFSSSHDSNNSTESEFAASGKAGVSLSPTGVSAQAKTEMSGGIKKKNVRHKKEKEDVKFKRLNVIPTTSHGLIHWELHPDAGISAETKIAYLEGSVFQKDAKSGECLACRIERTDNGSLSLVTVEGSVTALMNNFIIENIVFSDENGNEIENSHISKMENNPRTGIKRIFPTSPHDIPAIKERIVKAIIRKHLIDQGMNAVGASVEICKASS